MILDTYKQRGLVSMAQVDLEKRIHRNQDTRALGKGAAADHRNSRVPRQIWA